MKTLIVTFVIIVMAASQSNGQKNILILRGEGKEFEEVLRGISDELKEEFTVKNVVVSKETDMSSVIQKIHSAAPKLIILMDNTAIALYRQYQLHHSVQQKPIPSISLMGVLIKNAISDLKNATGISYEIPLVTSVVSLRSVIATPIQRIGIVHREFMDDFIKENIVYCEHEGITVLHETIANKVDSFEKRTKDGLNRLFKQGIDALWVPNDNALLQPDIIRNVWLPLINKKKVPVIVGIEILVNPKINFGTFAVLPDHVGLGTQTAEMTYDIAENGWQVKSTDVVPPLAIYKIINLGQARKFGINGHALENIDKKLK